MTPDPTPTQTTPDDGAAHRPGLHQLGGVVLVGVHERLYESLSAAMLGPPEWRARKRVELHELLALAQLAPWRFALEQLDATTDIRVLLTLRCPVPCMSPGNTDIRIEDAVRLHIRYPEAVIRGPLPGTGMVDIVTPNDVYLPNVLPTGVHSVQGLCLGLRIPRGFPLREALLLSHLALIGACITADEYDHAGVLNRESALFWQQRANSERLPLSRTPFLEEEPAS